MQIAGLSLGNVVLSPLRGWDSSLHDIPRLAPGANIGQPALRALGGSRAYASNLRDLRYKFPAFKFAGLRFKFPAFRCEGLD